MSAFLRRAAAALYDRPYLLLTLTSLFWAGNQVSGRVLATALPAFALSFVRWGGAFFVILPFALPHLRREWPIVVRHAGILVVLGLSSITINAAMSYTGLSMTTAVNSLLIQSAAPLLFGLWTFILFGDRLSPHQLAGIAASLVGVVVILCQGSLAVLLAFRPNPGDLFIFGALVVYSFYSAMLRKRPPLSTPSFLAAVIFVGWAGLVPGFWWDLHTGVPIVFTWTTGALIAYAVFLPSLIALLFYNRGVELVGANRAGPFFHLIPLFGSALAIVFLGESLQPYHFAGYALILCGIAVATWAGRPLRRRAA
ncbi:MAG TPA: DMT family transporter [Hyphomicrobiales bacterium]|nr:DMT family transporter [Hyphomicrobiales bacterium]